MIKPHPIRPNGILWADPRDGELYQVTTYVSERECEWGRPSLLRKVPMIRVEGHDGWLSIGSTKELVDPGEMTDEELKALIGRPKPVRESLRDSTVE